MKKSIIIISLAFIGISGYSQAVDLLSQGTKASFRGLSAVNDAIVWVSGSNGTIGRSVDSGKTWNYTQVKGFESTDFRDIEAFDENSAIIMGIDSPAYMLKTIDGGNNWKIVYEDHSKGIFLDAMDFDGNDRGMAIGDPINGRFLMLCTWDSGNSWKKVNPMKSPVADSGEACFASSGTNIVSRSAGGEMIVLSGGLSSNIIFKKEKIKIPVTQGKVSAGANSIAVKNSKTFIIVGGDFENKDATTENCAITYNSGKKWSVPKVAPHGYRSCIAYLGGKTWITCGLNGVDLTSNNGKKFKLISNTGFHVCKKAKQGNSVFLAGGNGRIGKLNVSAHFLNAK